MAGTSGHIYLFSASDNTPFQSWDFSGYWAELSKNGRYVLTYRSSEVRLLSSSSDSPLWVYENDYESIKSAAISADGSRIAIGTSYGKELGVPSGYVRLFSSRSSTPLWSYQTPVVDYGDYGVNSVAISGDGNYVAAEYEVRKFIGYQYVEEELRVFSSPDGSSIGSQKVCVMPLKMSSDGRYIIGRGPNYSYLFLFKNEAVETTNVPPSADFAISSNSPAATEMVQFTDESSDSDGTVVSWSWDFGDRSTSTSQNPSHSYSDNGTYTVTLTVTDDDGATDSYSQDVTVGGAGEESGGEAPSELPFPGWLLGVIIALPIAFLIAYHLTKRGPPEEGEKSGDRP